jgi:hypothetical protein
VHSLLIRCFISGKCSVSNRVPAVESKRFGWWSNPAITVHNTCLFLGYELLAFTWFWNYSLCKLYFSEDVPFFSCLDACCTTIGVMKAMQMGTVVTIISRIRIRIVFCQSQSGRRRLSLYSHCNNPFWISSNQSIKPLFDDIDK